MKIVYCQYCHQEFKKNVQSQLYCSQRCGVLYRRFARKEKPHSFKITRDISEFEELKRKIEYIMSKKADFDYACNYTLRTIELEHYNHILPEFKKSIEEKFDFFK